MEHNDDETRPYRGAHAADPTPAAPSSSTGVPLRGIGMIAIAVAILILLWAIFFFGGDKDSGSVATTTEAATTSASATTTVSSSVQVTTTEEVPPAESTPAETPAEAPAAPAPAQDTHPQVHVLNNSTVQGLAADVANRLTSTGNTTGEVGNLPDVETPQSMVYFSPGDEAAAKRVADQLGINYGPKIPAVENYPGLVVVVTQDLQ